MTCPRTACVAALAVVGALVLAGCDAPRYESNWGRLHVGMPRAEVESMLGRPSSTYVPPPPKQADAQKPAPARGERWQYGDNLSSLATRAMFPEEADERAWCVFFAPDGTVIGFRPPSWSAAKAVDPPTR